MRKLSPAVLCLSVCVVAIVRVCQVQGEPLTCCLGCTRARNRLRNVICLETPARRIIGLMRRNPVRAEFNPLIATHMYNTRKPDFPSAAAVSHCHRYSPKDPRLRSTLVKLSTLIRLNSATTRQRTIRKSHAPQAQRSQ